MSLSILFCHANYFQGVPAIFPLQDNNVKAPLDSQPTSDPAVGMLLGKSPAGPKDVLPGQR